VLKPYRRLVITAAAAVVMQAAAEAEVQQLQSSLDSTNELLKKVMETATATEAEAAAAKEAVQKEVDALKAKLAEAAGVLNAKEELREARWVGQPSTMQP
jgi:peptidoglycan hydrolase CwlO-like protein